MKGKHGRGIGEFIRILTEGNTQRENYYFLNKEKSIGVLVIFTPVDNLNLSGRIHQEAIHQLMPLLLDSERSSSKLGPHCY